MLNRCLLGRLPFRIELLRLKAQLLQSVRIVFQKKIQTPEVGEPFSVEMMTGFVLIWTAVVVFTVDTVRTTARLRREINRRAAEDS